MEHNKQDLNRLRNAIHNEVGITKQEIREMVEEAVERIVDKRFKQIFPTEVSLDRMVDEAVRKRSHYWGKTDEQLNDKVVDKMARLLVSKLKINLEKK